METESRGVVAVTGATGFLGRHLVRALAEDGWTPRVLVRRDPIHPLWRDFEVEVVAGDLKTPGALQRLSEGASVVIHVAGLIKATSLEGFNTVNRDGALAAARAAREASARFILVSSLAAREPALSNYAASKRAGEDAVLAETPHALIARPPAIYGPGDTETLEVFKLAASSPFLPVLSPTSRVAMIHVQDAAAQLANYCKSPSSGLVELSDVRRDGYTWAEIMSAAAAVMGRNPRLIRLPAGGVLAAGALADAWSFVSQTPTVFGFGKARELLHADWTPSSAPRAEGVPSVFGLLDGFAHTVEWYRKQGWLP
ncbi:epimerase [Caulobacter segnis]|uniref:NAD-dependent epimerase/dehydratase n=2 Tax=Caulobacter segnis TaxID=88688 RepID=D5VKZ0_CAUST|nr:ceramide reductase [Caulobacter segnis]ADG11163.1 NAD-dependent epimerase/dehydratase [Caulobacter segnis ATCC 21756]AVQ02848.1 epimerase [Caulobacter segnis]